MARGDWSSPAALAAYDGYETALGDIAGLATADGGARTGSGHADMITPWTGAHAGDTALDGSGGLVLVDEISISSEPGHPDFLVACIDGRETRLDGTVTGRLIHLDPPAANLTAVRRTEGTAAAPVPEPKEKNAG